MTVSKRDKKIKWFFPELDLSRYSEKEIQKEIDNYIKENRRRIYLGWIENEYDELEKVIKFGSMLLRYYIEDDIEDTDQKFLFKLGTLKGIVECFEHLLYEKGQQLRIEDRIHIASLSIKYFDRVISILLTHKRISHTALCEILNLKPSTLTEAMKKILQTQMIQASFAGKYKIYSLTDAGLRYARSRHRELKGRQGFLENQSISEIWVTSPIGKADNFGTNDISNELMIASGDKIRLHQRNTDNTREYVVNNMINELDKEGISRKHLFVDSTDVSSEVTNLFINTYNDKNNLTGLA